MKNHAALLALLVLAASCASLNPQRPPGFEALQSAWVEVRADASVQEGHARMLEGMLVAALEERQVFRAVRTGAAEDGAGSVFIEVVITRLREASNIDRITLGRMAGSNVVAADVVVTDGATRQVLSRFSLKGESPDYPPSFDWPWGSLEDAMDRLTRRLANILLEWRQEEGARA